MLSVLQKGNEELRDTVWAEVIKLYEAGEIDKLAEQYEVADMLCIGKEETERIRKAETGYDLNSNASAAFKGNAGNSGDFRGNTFIFTPTGTSCMFWKNGKKQSDSWNCFRIHFYHEGDTPDAAAYGSIFRTILYFRNPHLHELQSDCSIHCICD